MEHQQYQKKRVAQICIKPYLATYAKKKFEIDPKTGGIKIPDSFDLYHCIWQLMERQPRHQADGSEQKVNLTIWLPFRRTTPSKHPEYWNYIPPRKHWIIEKALRQLFNWEFHHYVEGLITKGTAKVDAVRSFIRYYGLGLDCEDALLKNMQRYERSIQAFLGIQKTKNKKKRKI